ncbi:hypothetical protein GCM10023238_10630 [Streptomyces heliomycini]
MRRDEGTEWRGEIEEGWRRGAEGDGGEDGDQRETRGASSLREKRGNESAEKEGHTAEGLERKRD